jgi:hypothetical protein
VKTKIREEEPLMSNTSALHVYVHAPHLVARALARTAKSGIYLVRGVPRDLQRAARARAARETTTLSSVLRQALREYAAGTWTPRPADK